MKFSVLLSLYKNSDIYELEECLKSIENNTLKPDETILVFDGSVNTSADYLIQKFKTINLKVIKLKYNKGLGIALKEGLSHCSNEFVFRMDTDDICYPHRFEKQLKYMNDNPTVDILGSNVTIIDKNGLKVNTTKKVPLKHSDIIKIIHFKNPINHPTVLYRKSKIELAGSYEDQPFYEDWLLWIKALKTTSIKFLNIEEPLVYYRIRSIGDRRGSKILKYEKLFFDKLYQRNYISMKSYYLNIILRFIARNSSKKIYRIIKLFFDKIK